MHCEHIIKYNIRVTYVCFISSWLMISINCIHFFLHTVLTKPTQSLNYVYILYIYHIQVITTVINSRRREIEIRYVNQRKTVILDNNNCYYTQHDEKYCNRYSVIKNLNNMCCWIFEKKNYFLCTCNTHTLFNCSRLLRKNYQERKLV